MELYVWKRFAGSNKKASDERRAHMILGTVSAVKQTKLNELKEFWSQYWTQDNVVLGFGGSFTSEHVNQTASSIYSTLFKPTSTTSSSSNDVSPQTNSESRKETLESSKRRLIIVEKNKCDSMAISLGAVLPQTITRGTRDFYALWIANSFLGEHRNSSAKLFRVIREVRGINYGDYSYIETLTEGGSHMTPPPNIARKRQLFEVWIRPVGGSVDLGVFALKAAIREIESLVQFGMKKEDFEERKKFLQKYVKHYAVTTIDKVSWKIDDMFYGIKGEGIEVMEREIASIELEEVNRVVREVWGEIMRGADIVVVTEKGETEEDCEWRRK
eukprot:TRINITY_DN7849_c0_g1_i1.p1 TRINITY_DN7849_c0_g1~~TRINITY_DN7849_c0_g1_i1.p1  ORF type:complete len:358 (-),score=95.65 TRINITY_DN7849_c0_g1_i1:191-1177(-)